MAATEAVVIVLSESYRQKRPTMSTSHKGAHFIDFESCKEKLLLRRKKSKYEDQYAEKFLELEKACSLMMNGVVQCGSCNSIPAGAAARELLATGAKLQQALRVLDEDVSPVRYAQKIGKELHQEIKYLFIRHNEKPDLRARVSNLNLKCQQLRFILGPLLRAAKTPTPAHL